jgi:hypothetical protein
MGIGKTRRARRAASLVVVVAVGALALTISAATIPPFNSWAATQERHTPSAPFTPPGPYWLLGWDWDIVGFPPAR